jgi:hypothetical protein
MDTNNLDTLLAAMNQEVSSSEGLFRHLKDSV